jgi:hypothetical protein
MFSIILPMLLVGIGSLLSESVHANHHELRKAALRKDLEAAAKKAGVAICERTDP